MRTIALSLLLCIPVFIHAQTTAIPDANFEQALIDAGIDTDGTINQQVATSDISGISTLDVSHKNISDLTGIEDFSNLFFLTCDNNQLTNIDLSNLTILLKLNCSGNPITSLNLSQNTNLIELKCSGNPLGNLDLSFNTILTYIACNGTQLSSLDVGLNTALTYLDCEYNQLTSLDLTQNPYLEYLFFTGNQLTNIDLSQNVNLKRLYCLDNQLTDLDLSHNLDLTSINCINNQISEIDLGQNSALVMLRCAVNRISSLDLSNCPNLWEFWCQSNHLVNLSLKSGSNSNLVFMHAENNPNLFCIEVDNVGDALSKTGSTWHKDAIASYSAGCPDVTYIPDTNFEQTLIDQGIDTDGTINKQVFTSDISGISSLDVSHCNISDLTGIEGFSSLLILNCTYNQLTNIDLSQNTILIKLLCFANQLTGLSLSKNTNLIQLSCGGNPIGNLDLSLNPILTHILCSQTQLSSLDVSQNKALTVLDCEYSQLTSLDLTHNPHLEYLYCRYNQLTNLDLSQNTALIHLACDKNSLSSLDLSQNATLTELYCSDNLITSLDLSNNTGLTRLNCDSNQLEEITFGNNDVLESVICDENNIVRLDISQCSAINNLRCYSNSLTELNIKNGNNTLLILDATNNPFLYCIEVDDVDFANSHTSPSWWKDAIASYSEACPDVTYIPDANFEQALIDQGFDSDGTINQRVFTSDISILGTMDVSAEGISDLTGIEDFISLTFLDCSSNGITVLDLSQNTNLIQLDCSENQLTTLDINQNTELTHLWCDWNSLLNTLIISQNTKLIHLDCSENSLSSLNVSQNVLLLHLYCSVNFLSSLDVTKNPALVELDCAQTGISILDLSQNTSLQYLSCHSNSLTNLDLNNNTLLAEMHCGSNLLSTLDLSHNTFLTHMGCGFNQLSHIDLSHNPNLSVVTCLSNQLLSLDLSNHMNLTHVSCADNDLIRLNIKNGNNPLLSLFDATSNPNLLCIEVDDAAAATAGSGSYSSWFKDPIASYSEDCPGYTYVPDPFFEQALIDQGIDTEGTLDQYVLTTDISGLTDLNVNGLGISDLAGIEDFTSLTNLSCGSNLLASVDLNQNTNLSYLEITSNLLMNLNLAFNTGLIHLDCRSNQILNLDLSQNTLLDYLNCNDNQLTSLDIRFNPGLTSVFAASNEISSIDLSENSLLELLSCENNQLPGLDLSKNISLNTLICFLNFLPDLDLSLNPNLVQLWCFDNELSSLNVKNGNNPILTNFDATGNPFLSCIQVDNESDALAGLGVYGLWAIDPTATYSESCSATLLFCPLTSGWTWFSINVQAPDMSLDAVLGNLNLNDGDYIKSKAESSTYYTNYGWFGDLSIINVEETYKIKLVDPGTILFEGAPVDPSITPIPIGTGWNWIGYVPEGSLPLDVALASLWPMNNDYIKSQSESATYYDGHGWFGDLSAMDPLEGYMLKSGKDEALTYPDAPLAPISKADPIQVVGSKLQVAGCKLQDKKFSPTSFEYSGQVNAEVFLNGEIVGDEGDMLITMSEGRIVGQSSAIAFPPTGLPVFNHLAYENSEENRNLEFYFFDSSDDQWYKFEENLEFEPDMIEANAYKPFRLEKASMIQNPTSDIRHLTFLEVYPNPAADYITINLDLADDRNITLQILDPLGRIVDEIQPGNLTEGSHQFTHDIRFLKQGYYFIRIKDQAEIYRRLVIAH